MAPDAGRPLPGSNQERLAAHRLPNAAVGWQALRPMHGSNPDSACRHCSRLPCTWWHPVLSSRATNGDRLLPAGDAPPSTDQSGTELPADVARHRPNRPCRDRPTKPLLAGHGGRHPPLPHRPRRRRWHVSWHDHSPGHPRSDRSSHPRHHVKWQHDKTRRAADIAAPLVRPQAARPLASSSCERTNQALTAVKRCPSSEPSRSGIGQSMR